MEKLIITAVVALGLGMFAAPFWTSKTEAKAPVQAVPTIRTYEQGYEAGRAAAYLEATHDIVEAVGNNCQLVGSYGGKSTAWGTFPTLERCEITRKTFREEKGHDETRVSWACSCSIP